MKRSDEVVFVRECGKHEKLYKNEFYKMIGVKEICICQDNYNTDELNKIHGDIKIKDLSDEALIDFLTKLGTDYYLASVLREIDDNGYWEAFNDGYNSVNYSAIRFLNYQGEVFASEVFDGGYFSRADTSLFNHICQNQISGIKEIYIKSWW
jgi:hypothetical protein